MMFKKAFFTLVSLALLITCTDGDKSKDSKRININKRHDLVAKGFFTINEQLQFSDGQYFYCNFSSWEEFGKLSTKKVKLVVIARISYAPSLMKNYGACDSKILNM